MKLGDLVNCGKLFHPIGPHPLRDDCFNPRLPSISPADRIDHLTAAANDLRERLEKLTLEQAAKDQELEKYKSLAAAAGLHDACEERRGRELRNEQERWIRAEELNARLREAVASALDQLRHARAYLGGAAKSMLPLPVDAQPVILEIVWKECGRIDEIRAALRAVRDSTSDNGTIRQPAVQP